MGREYDREWIAAVDSGSSRIRYWLSTERGTPVAFLVQLECRIPRAADRESSIPGGWYAVARFDHESGGPGYRDVAEVGLHLDVLRPDGTQLPKRRDFPRVPIEQAMRFADDYLRHHHDFLIARLRRWL